MKTKELEVLAANLYKEAEEAIPLFGDGDKKEWMGHRLDTILTTKDPLLNCLLGYTTISEVLDFLEKEYQERKDDKTDQVMPPCATAEPQKKMYSTSHVTHAKETSNAGVTAKADKMHSPTGIIEEEIIIVQKVHPDRKGRTLSSSDENFIC